MSTVIVTWIDFSYHVINDTTWIIGYAKRFNTYFDHHKKCELVAEFVLHSCSPSESVQPHMVHLSLVTPSFVKTKFRMS